MPLQIPTGQEIRDRILLRMQGRDVPLTDLTTIATLRILLEECLIEEFLALYAGLVREQRDWFLQTARGAALDRRLADFDLTRPAAELAAGTLLMNVDQAVTVPAGAAVETAEPSDGTAAKRYAVTANPDTADGSWALAPPSGTVRIAAAETGAAGNTPANTITVLRTGIAGITSIANPQPLMGGRDAASDAEFRQFFRDSLAARTRGPRDSILFYLRNYVDASGAKPIHSAALVEWGGQTLMNLSGTRPVALVIYIEDGTGSASPSLVQAVQQLVDGDDSEGSGLRAAGVPAEVRSAAPLPIDVDVVVDVERSANPVSVRQQVEEAVQTHLAALPVGGQLLSGELQGQLVFAQLFRDVMDVPGVLRARFNGPTADRGVPIGMKAVAGTVTAAAQAVI